MRYSGGPIVYRQISANSEVSLIGALRQALIDAGWSASPTTGRIVLRLTGNPLNDQGFEWPPYGGWGGPGHYQFKTTATLWWHIQIGATKEETAANFVAKIQQYEPTYLTAAVNGADVTLTDPNPGFEGDRTIKGFPSNMTLVVGSTSDGWISTSGGGQKLTSGLSPQGLQWKVHIYRFGRSDTITKIRVRGMSVDESVAAAITLGEVGLDTAPDRLLEIIANPYQFFVWLRGATATRGTVMYGCAPYLRPAHTPKQIVNAADNGGAFEIQLAVPHGLVTGQHAFLDRCLGVAGLNGAWQITVVDQYKYILNGSTYAAGYEQNSGFAAGPQEISRAFFLVGGTRPNVNDSQPCWRTVPYSRGGVHAAFLAFNQYAYSTDSDGRWSPYLQFPIVYDDGTAVMQVDNFGPYADILEPRVAWRLASKSATIFTVGELWDAFVLTDTVNADVEKVNFDSYNWINFMANNPFMSLWLATGVVS